MAVCNRCGAELTAKNWSPGFRRLKRKICTECFAKAHRRGGDGDADAGDHRADRTGVIRERASGAVHRSIDYGLVAEDLTARREELVRELEHIDAAIAAVSGLAG